MSTAKTAKSTIAFATQAQKLLASAQALAASFAALGLPTLTSDEVLHSNGKLRAGEVAAMTAIFDAMDAFPGVFAALAAKDGGIDPTKVETDPARTDLAQVQALAPLSAALKALDAEVSNAILALAGQAKTVSVPAYAIGKASAASDPQVRKALAAAITFYGRTAQKKAASKKLAATKAKNAKKTVQG
jgi:hypothetical protein